MTKYYSDLPWLAAGPMRFGAKEAEDVGLCTATGVKLNDDKECLPQFTKAAVCKAAGGAVHTGDTAGCSYTFEQLCKTLGEVTDDGKCKVGEVTHLQADLFADHDCTPASSTAPTDGTAAVNDLCIKSFGDMLA